MIPKIKIHELNNDFYSLKNTQNKCFNLYFVSPKKYSPYFLTEIAPSIKHIKLNKLTFYVGKNLNLDKNSNWDYNYEIYNIIKKELDKEHIKIISELGKLNRENYLDFGKHFDIDNINITADEIFFKLNQAGHMLIRSSNESDIWILSNNPTFSHIFSKLENFTWNTKCPLNNMTFFVNDLVEDGMIIMGQKSHNVEESSVICHILTDTNGNIVFEQCENDYNVELTMYFAFVGNNCEPESRYYYISTRDVRYYRNKKLQKIQKIRELYDKN